jgi:hypothetical protein
MMKRLALAVALLLAIPSVASADAAHDVKDIRAGQLPNRYEWLGWDGSTAHFRTLSCSEGGTTSCNANIVKQSDLATSRVELLSVVEVYCGSGGACAALTPPIVARFVARENAAIAALPTLTKGAPVTDATRVFGAVGGEATQVAVHPRVISADPNIAVELVLKGKGGAMETLGTLDTRVFRLNGSAIKGAHLSVDGKTAAFVVQTDVGVMCWDFSGIATVVVDVSRRRSSLANTIGWRAYQKRDLGAALAGFTEATTIDPSFGLGWYNRASVESRNADLTSAETSFQAALKLDASFAKRACKDPDFKPLRASAPTLFRCDA